MMLAEREQKISTLIATEQFDSVQNEVLLYASEVATNVTESQRAADFIRKALVELKARRAHYMSQLIEVSTAQSYTAAARNSSHSTDYIG